MFLSSLPFNYSSALVRLGGLGGILGGVLWVVLLLVVQLQMLSIVHFYDVPEPPCCDMSRPYSLDNPILVVPVLLFLLSLPGLYMYTRQQLALGKLRTVSIILSLSGIILAIVHVFLGKYSVWWFGGWWYGGYGGLFDTHYMPPLGMLWVLWYATFGPGLVLLALGMALFGLSIMKTKVISTWTVLVLIITSLAMSLMPLVIKVLLEYEHILPDMLSNYAVFMGVLVLFGLAWVSLGFTLFRGANMLIALDE